MIETLIPYLESAVEIAKIWGPWLIIVFMAVESSLVPFPSEVVMIPAGFMCARGEFWPHGTVLPAIMVVLICGLTGAMLGAYFNYCLALWLGRPFLHKYGRYFLLKSEYLDRAEELFRKHGEVTTFVCRLLPAIRQLISLPAGLSKMDFGRFSFFTGLGATVWNTILTLIGWSFGRGTANMSYADIVHQGTKTLHDHLLWIILGCAVIVAGYFAIQKWVMTSRAPGKV